jgi:hypothetical protein
MNTALLNKYSPRVRSSCTHTLLRAAFHTIIDGKPLPSRTRCRPDALRLLSILAPKVIVSPLLPSPEPASKNISAILRKSPRQNGAC